MAKDAARAAGHDGPVSFDAKANVMVFAGMGELAMGELADRLPGMTFPQMERAIATKVNWFLRYHHPIPDGWSFADSKLERRASDLWWRIDHERDFSSRSMEERARLEQIQGLASWFGRLGAAAHAYAVEGRAKPGARNHLVIAAQLATELGDQINAGTWAQEYLDAVSPSVLGASSARITEFVVAVAITSGWQGLLPVSDLLGSLDGHSHAQNLVEAAQAIERRDSDSLVVVLRSARHWERSSEEHSPHYLLGGDRTATWVAATIEEWAVAAGMEGSTVPEPPTTVSVTDIVSDENAHTVGWTQSGLLVDGEPWPVDVGVHVASKEIDVEGCGEIQFLETRITIQRDDQIVVLLEVAEDEPTPHEYVCSPDGKRIALWSDHGPITVVNADGSDLRELYGHLDGPNLGVAFAGDRMASWAGDGQVAVWNLSTRRLLTIDVDGWADQVEFGAGGDYVTVGLRGGWSVFSTRSGDQIGPTRFASQAVWHAELATLALANDESVWLESYSAG